MLPEVWHYLREMADRTGRILGRDLVGVYAAGSLALHAYQPGRSDIDIAIVCSGPLTRPAKRALVDALRHEALPCPARGLELVVYRAEFAAAGTSEPGFEVELNSGPRMPFRVTWSGADRGTADGTFWYAVDRSILAAAGRAVAGPPAGAVFRSVPDGVLATVLAESLRWHLTLDRPAEPPEDEPGPPGTDDAVLNACRARQRIRTGRWSDKVSAGRDVLADAPTPVVEQALAARSGGPMPSRAAARAWQEAVLAELAATRP
ncbi:nucleotidyltransferase domain-containing protein [Nakamurella flava]|uniref:Nucleotidyltransferase domain-containing protein n=1 Tax=Nakamurella flava TaxID=2576308 RepID=A0A4U6Q9B5_9ACTN|nr:nucleotidyltransferase domain-containing protein [Nakamurella flava]